MAQMPLVWIGLEIHSFLVNNAHLNDFVRPGMNMHVDKREKVSVGGLFVDVGANIGACSFLMGSKVRYFTWITLTSL